MRTSLIRERCKINTNRDGDTFVGIMCQNGELSFNFPLGFNVSDDDKELRREILLVLNSIAITTGKNDSEINISNGLSMSDGFSLQSYFYIIADFFEHGYYKEKTVHYGLNKRGKIVWNKTIKTQKPYISDNNAVYLDFVVKTTPIKDNELITLIHKYCVYESFDRVGWIFTPSMPEKPALKFNQRLFHSVIAGKLDQTFNDETRRLLKHMLRIVDGKSSADEEHTNYKYGTDRFEYVWEKAIDAAFGIKNKADYFPKTYWKINGKEHENAVLEPDTIMIYENNVYVLDAKYYKYGVTKRPSDLPESTSINKQITYGEFIDTQAKFKKIHGEKSVIYNAFLMPYASDVIPYSNCGIAYSDWKSGNKPYENIQGILVDLKHVLKLAASYDQSEINKLAKEIRQDICNESE